MDTAQKSAAAHGLIERLLIIAAAFRRQSAAIFGTLDQTALLRRNN
jgi:hypothetical protein